MRVVNNNNNIRETVLRLVNNGASDEDISHVTGWGLSTVRQYVGALAATRPGVGLYGQYLALTAKVAREYENDPQELEDLIQAIWLHIMENKSKMPAETKAWSTWIHVLTENFCKNYIRDKMTSRDMLDVAVRDSELTPPVDEDGAALGTSFIEAVIPSPYNNSEEELALDEFIQDASSKLSELEYCIFINHFIDGKSYTNLADDLKLTESTLRTVSERIRTKLCPKPARRKGDWSWKERNGPWIDRSDLLD